MPKKPKKQKLLYIALLAISIVVFAISAMLASQKILFSWERAWLFDIYNLPISWRWPALVITQFGSAWILVGLSIYLLIGRKLAQHRGRLIVINGFVGYVLVELAKHIVARSRPALLISGVTQREPFVSGFGFPSGHVAVATIISLSLVRFLPKQWRWLPAIWIPLVALSRLYLGVHAPLDIIGGFALGLCVVTTEYLLKIV